MNHVRLRAAPGGGVYLVGKTTGGSWLLTGRERIPMTAARRFRFAVELHEPFAGRTWTDTVREAEALGYSTMFVPDHFDEGLGPIAAMATRGGRDHDDERGTLVLDCDFRHPAVLARELATIDLLSEGRLEVGVGAGWKRPRLRTLGHPDGSAEGAGRPDDRAHHVLNGCSPASPFSFAGEHYRIDELDGTPSTAPAGGPPILIGGGAQRVLRFAGATADIVGVNASVHSGEIDVDAGHDGCRDRIDEKIGWVREGAATASTTSRSTRGWPFAEVTDDPAASPSCVAELFEHRPDELPKSPLVLIGIVAEMDERLQRAARSLGLLVPRDPGRQGS